MMPGIRAGGRRGVAGAPYSLSILDLPFSEATTADVVDHSPNNSTLEFSPSTAGSNTVGGRYNVTDAISANPNSRLQTTAYGFPEVTSKFEIRFNFAFTSLDVVNKLEVIWFGTSAGNNFSIDIIGTVVASIPGEPLVMVIRVTVGGVQTEFYRSTTILEGDFVVTVDGDSLVVINNGDPVVDVVSVNNYTGAPALGFLSAYLLNAHTTPALASIDDVTLEFFYEA